MNGDLPPRPHGNIKRLCYIASSINVTCNKFKTILYKRSPVSLEDKNRESDGGEQELNKKTKTICQVTFLRGGGVGGAVALT